ncbi:MAG: glutamate--tRNA ligase [bacterium]|nr:glutamate--tRNA ligase [bacterium]
MTNKELAELMFPNLEHDVDYYEKLYPERNLPEGAVVTRFAPSPTGFVHMGSLLSAFVEQKIPKDSKGVFYLRIEDTDGKRSIENGVQGIIDDLKNFEIKIDEGPVSETEEIGKYGPYTQSQRKEIYHTYAKHLVEQGFAYPCFCSQEEIDKTRKMQELNKERIGIYGSYAKCRFLTNEEKAEKIRNREPYILRLKSPGDFNKKVVLNDLVRGRIEFPENDMDIVLIKSDGLPLYHFAHVIDDHLMRTTHVLRGEEWVSSTPIHLQLFEVLGFEAPKYAHLGLVMKIDEDGSRRKLSKRKDPEAAVSFYHEKGIPVEAVKLYLMTIANSNFEGWWDQNPTLGIDDFKFDFKKMSISGSLFDLEKLISISKSYISRLKANEVYEKALVWAKEFDQEFANVLEKYRDYSIAILNIEREQKKPRKDFESFSSIKKHTWYMYDEYFTGNLDYDFGKIQDQGEIQKILSTYTEKYFDETDDKETWFHKIKELSNELGYCSDMKEYKANPDHYKGSVADVSTVIRVAVTTSSMTPDLYEILKLLGKERIEKRIQKWI